jgi:hypothetical protein
MTPAKEVDIAVRIHKAVAMAEVDFMAVQWRFRKQKGQMRVVPII